MGLEGVGEVVGRYHHVGPPSKYHHVGPPGGRGTIKLLLHNRCHCSKVDHKLLIFAVLCVRIHKATLELMNVQSEDF